MDFEPQFTQEQEEFRIEVRAWLKEHVPTDLVEPADAADFFDCTPSSRYNAPASRDPRGYYGQP